MRDLKKIIDSFENKNGKIICNDKGELLDFIRDQHNGILPDDFIFEKICEAFEAIENYEIETESIFEDAMGEISDNMTSFYNHDLIEHYKQFPDYADDAKTDNVGPEATIMDCLSMGYYLHCMELLTSCWEFLQGGE